MKSKMFKRIILIVCITLFMMPQVVCADDTDGSQFEETKIVLIADIVFVDGENIKTICADYGSYISEPEHQKLENAEFLGWYKVDGTRWDFAVDVVTGDMKLYAKYNKTAAEKETNKVTMVDNTIIVSGDSSINSINAETDYNGLSINDQLVIDDGGQLFVKTDFVEADASQKEEIKLKAESNSIAVADSYVLSVGKKYSEEEEWQSGDDTNTTVSVTITIPEEYRDVNNMYTLYYVDDNGVEAISSDFADENWNVSFETKKSGNYSLSYKIENGRIIGTNASVLIYIVIVMLFIYGTAIAIVLYKRNMVVFFVNGKRYSAKKGTKFADWAEKMNSKRKRFITNCDNHYVLIVEQDGSMHSIGDIQPDALLENGKEYAVQ